MDKLLWMIICFLLSVNSAIAQVSQGTVFSKTEDGNGNKITSTVTGPSRGLDINCLAGCAGGGGGGTSSTFGAAFPATGTAAGFSDGTPNMRPGFAVDTDTGVGTTFAQGVNLVFRANGGPVEAGTVANPFNVTGTVAATQSGVWNIGTLTSITNPVAVTGTFFQATQPVSGTVAVSNAFLLDATFTGRINTLGQKAMAASTPVVLASDQTSIPVAATVSNAFLLDATFTGRLPVAFLSADNIAAQTATFIHGGCYGWDSGGGNWDRCLLTAGALNVSIQNATLAVTQSGTWTVQQGTPPWQVQSNSLNLATQATLATLLLDATFTGRINTQGQKTMAASTPVVLPSDQAAIPITLTSTTITGTVTVQGANTNNNAAPGATNVGVLPCVANAVAPVYIEGNQTLCSQNLSGGIRTDITQVGGAAITLGPKAQANSIPVVLPVDQVVKIDFPPLIPIAANILQMRSLMKYWCLRNLCSPTVGGLR